MATFEEVNERFNGMVWLVAKRFYPSFPRSLYDLEDVHQIALMGLYNAYENFDESIATFSTFAYQCINNALSVELEKARAKKRTCPYTLVALTGEDGSEYIVDDTITPVDEHLVDKWLVGEILKRLTELPPEEQLVVYQTCFCGRSIRSVAIELGRPYASIFDKVKNFKLKIREELK